MFGIEFYPTPDELAKELTNDIDFSKYESDSRTFRKVMYVLEPSAGTGNLIKGLKANCNDYYDKVVKKVEDKFAENDEDRYRIIRRKDLHVQTFLNIDCCEIDNDLKNVLIGNKYNVIADDFLELKTFKHYDLIIMNPPFSNGDRHLLKALNIMKYGGSIRCILNAETLKNPYTNTRKLLLKKLNDLHANVEFRECAFSNADRETDVEIAIIKVDINYSDKLKTNYLDELKRDKLQVEFEENLDTNEDTQIVERGDMIDNLIERYDDEVQLTSKIINDFEALTPMLTENFNDGSTPILNLVVRNSLHKNNANGNFEFNKVNLAIEMIRKKYWYALFESKEMSNLMTTTTKMKYYHDLEKMVDYDFNRENIMQLKLNLSNSLINNLEESIVACFDKFTKHNMNVGSSNIHYFNGWCTNNAYYINKKVIIPKYDLVGYRGRWNYYNIKDELKELEQIFGYLDNNYDEIKGDIKDSITEDISRTYTEAGNRDTLEGKYFSVKLHKKGTYHIFFKDLDLLKKFNIFVGKKKNWLPDSYGSKSYETMSKEEKAVVDSFEGAKSYKETLNNPKFSLGVKDLLRLGN